jgi:iron complex transport system permease protein
VVPTLKKSSIFLSGMLLLLVLLSALAIGRYNLSPLQVFGTLKAFFTGNAYEGAALDMTVVVSVRLPRILLAGLIGASLSAAGCALQSLFSNPLVSSQILGVSNGAGLGAALGILLSGSIFVIQGLSVLMGLGAMGLTLLISRNKRGKAVHMLVLSGVIVGSIFQALISFIKYIADPEEKLPSIVYWLMGSLAGTSMNDLKFGVPPLLASLGILFMIRWQLNVLSLNEEEALSLGINLKLIRMLVIVSSTVISAVSVSLSGIIGFVGLVVPHVSRMITGPDHRILLPVSIFLGGSFMVIVDTLCRSLTTAEIPLSILTALIGAPFFAYLLSRTGGGWND